MQGKNAVLKYVFFEQTNIGNSIIYDFKLHGN